jgi:dephospho-CoA kinase
VQVGKAVVVTLIINRTDYTEIVPWDLWVKAQGSHFTTLEEFCADRERGRPAGRRRKYILSGKIHCPECGLSLGVQPDNRGERHLRCRGRQEGLCHNNSSYSLRTLDSLVFRGLSEILSSQAFEQLFEDNVANAVARERESVEHSRLELTKRIQEGERKLNKLDEKLFDDPDLKDRLRSRIKSLEDDLERFRIAYAQLPTQIPDFGIEEIASLQEAISAAAQSSPFEAKTLEEEKLLDLMQKLIVSAEAESLSRWEKKAVFCYDFGAALSLKTPALQFTRTFVYDNREIMAEVKNGLPRTTKLVASGKYELTDAEYEQLSATQEVRHHLGTLDEPSLRRALNALFLAAAANATVNIALKALGADQSNVVDAVFRFRSSPDIEAFGLKLAEIRSDDFIARQKLKVAVRRTRHVRYRLEKLEHPILRLSNIAVDGRDLSDKQWRAIAGFAPPGTSRQITRRDLNALFYVIRRNLPFFLLPPGFGGSTNTAKRIERLFQTGAFAQMTKALLKLEGIVLDDEEIPPIPKRDRKKR